MRLLKCILCIAIVYLLSPVNGLTSRDTLDGAAKVVIAAQSLAPEAGKAIAMATTRNSSAVAADPNLLARLIGAFFPTATPALGIAKPDTAKPGHSEPAPGKPRLGEPAPKPAASTIGKAAPPPNNAAR